MERKGQVWEADVELIGHRDWWETPVADLGLVFPLSMSIPNILIKMGSAERQLAWYTKGFSLRVLLHIPGKPQTQNLLSSTSCVLEFLSPQHLASLLSFEIPVRNKVKVSNKHTLRLLRQIANYWAGLIKEQNMRTERKSQPPLLKLP